MLTRPSMRAARRGFSLVELMVALVVGLVVIGAVLALVVSIMKSNRETLQATRLNQELRATLAVIANDLRRARSVDDPLTEALNANGSRFKKLRIVSINGGLDTCAIYGYQPATGGGEWHVITLDTGSLRLHTAPLDLLNPPDYGEPNACSEGSDHGPLGSAQVFITSLQIKPTQQEVLLGQATTNDDPTKPTDEGIVREVTITLSGHLVDPNTGVAGVTRTMRQAVFLRSVGVGI